MNGFNIHKRKFALPYMNKTTMHTFKQFRPVKYVYNSPLTDSNHRETSKNSLGRKGHCKKCYMSLHQILQTERKK